MTIFNLAGVCVVGVKQRDKGYDCIFNLADMSINQIFTFDLYCKAFQGVRHFAQGHCF